MDKMEKKIQDKLLKLIDETQEYYIKHHPMSGDENYTDSTKHIGSGPVGREKACWIVSHILHQIELDLETT